jgi:hypothetical protein
VSGNIDRRGFIRSLFGITGALPVAQQMAEAKGQTSFYWCNFKTGQVGFPTGLFVPRRETRLFDETCGRRRFD